MANTTWITKIINESNLDIYWEDGEDIGRRGTIKRKNGQTPTEVPFDNTGFCFPWVDHTKEHEIKKAIRFEDASNGKLLFVIFQSYNKDTIQWLKDPSSQYANNATDVPGPAGTGGKKAIIIPLDPNVPHIKTIP